MNKGLRVCTHLLNCKREIGRLCKCSPYSFSLMKMSFFKTFLKVTAVSIVGSINGSPQLYAIFIPSPLLCYAILNRLRG